MPQYLKLSLEPGETEVYAPAADCYISIREDGTIIVKKASGQENLHCHFWREEASKIRKHKISHQLAPRLAKILG